MQTAPKSTTYKYQRTALRRRIAKRMEAFSQRNYIFLPRMRSPNLPVYELEDGETIEPIMEEMKKRYKHFYYTLLPNDMVEVSEPIYPYEGYAERNLKPVLRQIVEVGYKPQDERPPCRLVQLKKVVKHGRPKKSKNE